MKPSELLDASADRVLQGWTQGKIRDRDTGAVCASGAMAEVIGNSWNLVIMDCVVKASDEMIHQIGFNDIPAWNDMPGRTAGEVADAMRTAAKVLRERGE